MKTKAFILGAVLTALVSGQLFAQVDTTQRQKKDTSSRKDTAWKDKRDTNQVSLNEYYRQRPQTPAAYNTSAAAGWTFTKMLTQDMITANDRWFVRKNKNEDWKQGMI